LVERFRRFVREHCAEFPCQLAYWTSLTEDDVFPVVEIIRQTLNFQSNKRHGKD
jgi:hypothetical protein